MFIISHLIKIIVSGASVANLVQNFPKRHPVHSTRPLIDYSGTLLPSNPFSSLIYRLVALLIEPQTLGRNGSGCIFASNVSLVGNFTASDYRDESYNPAHHSKGIQFRVYLLLFSFSFSIFITCDYFVLMQYPFFYISEGHYFIQKREGGNERHDNREVTSFGYSSGTLIQVTTLCLCLFIPNSATITNFLNPFFLFLFSLIAAKVSTPWSKIILLVVILIVSTILSVLKGGGGGMLRSIQI